MKHELTKAETKALSGSAYVPIVMRAPDTSEDLSVGRVRILKPHNCNHTSDICAKCASHWEYDYHFFYDRTEGGRRLKSEVIEL